MAGVENSAAGMSGTKGSDVLKGSILKRNTSTTLKADSPVGFSFDVTGRRYNTKSDYF